MRMCFLRLIIVTVSATVATGADWHLLRDENSFCVSERGLLFVDLESVSVLNDGAVEAWVKYEAPTEFLGEARSNLITLRKELKLSVKGFDRWGYDMALIKWKCEKELICLVETISYDTLNNVIEDNKLAEEQWNKALPGSTGDCLLKGICEVGGVFGMGTK